ncbi:MAG: hypothetical protein PF692_13925 [Kiritimatiellae bacterium]|jgi:hypothetical protein|nr:hypothetical protein [Kiritimatiellia bacterium]
MKRVITILFACLLAGCATVGPVQRRATQMRVAEVDFKNAPIVDVIVFGVEEINRPDYKPVSLALCSDQPSEDKKSQYPELYSICGDKTITFNSHNISILDLIDSIASRAKLKIAFRNDQLVILTKDGKVVMK